jgi:hypothetical protein
MRWPAATAGGWCPHSRTHARTEDDTERHQHTRARALSGRRGGPRLLLDSVEGPRRCVGGREAVSQRPRGWLSRARGRGGGGGHTRAADTRARACAQPRAARCRLGWERRRARESTTRGARRAHDINGRRVAAGLRRRRRRRRRLRRRRRRRRSTAAVVAAVVAAAATAAAVARRDSRATGVIGRRAATSTLSAGKESES